MDGGEAEDRIEVGGGGEDPHLKKNRTLFPQARIKKLMQQDEEVGRIAASTPVVISRCLELFLNDIVSKAAEIASSRGGVQLLPAHLKHVIETVPHYDFLKARVETVPSLQENEVIRAEVAKARAPRGSKKAAAAAAAAAAAEGGSAPAERRARKPVAKGSRKRTHDKFADSDDEDDDGGFDSDATSDNDEVYFDDDGGDAARRMPAIAGSTARRRAAAQAAAGAAAPAGGAPAASSEAADAFLGAGAPSRALADTDDYD